jgi:hypothetical protein
MVLLYGPAARFTAQHGGFRRGQEEGFEMVEEAGQWLGGALDAAVALGLARVAVSKKGAPNLFENMVCSG